MQIEIYCASESEYYIRLPGASGALRWLREGDRWSTGRAELPDAAQPMALSELPRTLQEELLAFVARTEAMGNQLWSEQN